MMTVVSKGGVFLFAFMFFYESAVTAWSKKVYDRTEKPP